MKYRISFHLFIISIILIVTNEQKLDLNTYYSERRKISAGWYDIASLVVECPNEGVLKNFVLRKENNELFYEYQCYSSLSPYIDYGEPIIKGLTLSTTFNGSYGRRFNNHLYYINGLSVECWADYGLHKFQILAYSQYGYINREALCHGVKPSYTTTMSIKTQTKTGNAYTLDPFFDVVVGSTEKENDVDIGFPLRGFKYEITTYYNSDIVSAYYIYSYAKLRNMKIVRDSYKQRFEELRNSNTQKN